MTLSKLEMKAVWNAHKAHIDEMFLDDTDNKKIFEELCSPVYSGDEFENIPGVIDNDISNLIEAFCHIIIADYAIKFIIDSQVLCRPDHSEILTAICGQLKRDNISLQVVLNAVDAADSYGWFITDNVKCTEVHIYIENIWNNARKYSVK